MITIFSNRLQADATRQFQAWRLVHWHDGNFLNCTKTCGRADFTLHAARCRHFEHPSVQSDKSLTKIPKICSTNRAELYIWAQAQGAMVKFSAICRANLWNLRQRFI